MDRQKQNHHRDHTEFRHKPQTQRRIAAGLGVAALLFLLAVGIGLSNLSVDKDPGTGKNTSDTNPVNESAKSAEGSDNNSENGTGELNSESNPDLNSGNESGSGAYSENGEGNNTGANTGKDTGANAGANTGANAGANTGANAGANTGANAGANTGANVGANTGANAGANTGANTGANASTGTGTNAGVNEDKNGNAKNVDAKNGDAINGDAQNNDAANDVAGEPDSKGESESERPVIVINTEDEVFFYSPHSTPQTDPEKWMKLSEIRQNGKTVESGKDFRPWYQMEFGIGSEYTEIPGVLTFRGNSFRASPSYGISNGNENRIKELWKHETGTLTSKGKSWSGSGWTGQPLIVKWPEESRKHMDMLPSAKAKQDLVEVIYACLDGYIYFLDLETGEKTREPLYLGFSFKGAGALDPRGYPLMYVGAGYDSAKGKAGVFIINLLDNSVMYTFGSSDPYSLRGSLSFFDSSPLVDAKSDTLIYPGENGILYLIRLHTVYNEKTGSLSISPEEDVIKWRYSGKRSGSGSYWVGMEGSAAIYEGYLYIADNGGHLMCLDLNTLSLVWVQDVLDDTNGSPVLSAEDGHLYLYIGTSFHLGWRSSKTASVPVWKIDAETGEIVWETSFECQSDSGVSGGIQSTVALGREKLSDSIYVTVSKTDGHYKGVLACLDKKTGKIKWEHKSAYSWSSPICLYREDGSGRVLYCNSEGRIFLLDGENGKEYDCLSTGAGNIEASPAAYNEYVVVGTRGCRIYGLRIQ